MRNDNMPATIDTERQHFYRAAILVFRHGSEILRKIVENHCESSYISFQQLLAGYDHVFYHMWQRDGCCQCASKKATYTSGYMTKSQFECMFVRKNSRQKCKNSATTLHKLCSCSYVLRSGLLPRGLDIPVLSCILLYIKDFKLHSDSLRAIRDIRRLRNEVLAHAGDGKMSDFKFNVTWKQTRKAILLLADALSVHAEERLTDVISRLLEDPVSLYASFDILGVIKHGNEMELNMLEDLKRVKEMIDDGRQGELDPMLDIAMELAAGTLGFTDPLVEELQNVKLLLLDDKIKEVTRKLEGTMLVKIMSKRLQIQRQVLEAYENIYRKDPNAEDEITGFRFKNCGDNIFITDDHRHAQWLQRYTAGFLFTHRPLDKLEHVTLTVWGTGQVAIGFIQKDPEEYTQNLSKLADDQDLKIGINIKLLKSSNEIIANLGSVNDEGKLILSDKQQEYAIDIDRSCPVWLVFSLKYGDVRLEMTPGIGKVLKFHDVRGGNTQHSDGNKRCIKLQHENHGAVCRLNHRFFCGEEITIYVKPLKDSAGASIIGQMRLGITTEGLRSGSIHDLDPFTSASRSWLILRQLSKTSCIEKIELSVSLNGCVSVACSRGVTDEAFLKESEMKFGVALFFELFKCELEISAYKVKTK